MLADGKKSTVSACPGPQSRDVDAAEARLEEREVTVDDINAMAAKVLKAELMSDTAKVTKLKNNLEKLREAQLRGLKVRMHVTHRDKKMSRDESTVVRLTRLNDRGVEMPVSIPNLPSNLTDIKKSKRVLTHDARGECVAFLPEDASTKSLSEVIREEQFRSSHDMEDEFVRLAAKSGRNVDDEYADMFVPKRSHMERDAYRLKQDAVAAYKRRMFAESSCTVCLERVPKHLVISVGEKVFLTLPEYVSLVPGHCLLVPYEHASSVTRLDDCTRRELIDFKRQIVAMFTKYLNGSGCVFMETATKPDSPRSHTQLECIPVPADILPSVSAYFKKALNELGSEWDQNRRLINLKPQGVGAYGSIPPKFAYFAVEFGLLEGGFARVVDDHRDIPSYFGREIIGEILGKDSRYWRKPKVEKFEALRQKVVQFEAWWEPFNKWSDRDPRNQPSIPVDVPDRTECPSPEGPMLPPDFSL
ncbi:hypothetical protein PHET_08699 [Paragonimus heterotremus]|uniref:CWF19-like protein 2 n=1 Tax=Paragonimus heterotremus TaxID=100268 RepID=A0A8J4T3Z3_9TREM|nr:hypothetical protein PHET_08699 [Paragonimus heterotremus]